MSIVEDLREGEFENPEIGYGRTIVESVPKKRGRKPGTKNKPKEEFPSEVLGINLEERDCKVNFSVSYTVGEQYRPTKLMLGITETCDSNKKDEVFDSIKTWVYGKIMEQVKLFDEPFKVEKVTEEKIEDMIEPLEE